MTTATRPAFINTLNRFSEAVKFVMNYPEWERERSLRAIRQLHERSTADIKRMGTNVLLMNACAIKFAADCQTVNKQVDANANCWKLAFRAIEQYENEPSPELLQALEHHVQFMKRDYQL